jgi:DNA-binding SARP family transcriptional activator
MLLVPLALTTALRAPVEASVSVTVDALVAIAASTWAAVAWSLARTVRHALRGGSTAVEPGPIGWAAVRIASLLLLLAPFLDRGIGPSTPARAATSVSTQLAPVPRPDRPGESSLPRASHAATSPPQRAPDALRWAGRRGGHRRRVEPISQATGLLVPLAAELRRRRRLSSRVVVDDEVVIDRETALLSEAPGIGHLLVGVARTLAAAGRLTSMAHAVVLNGEAMLADGSWSFDPGAPQMDARCLVVVLGDDTDGTHVLFVPRGATLSLSGTGATSTFDDAVRVATALGTGRPVVATPSVLLDVLARRSDDEVVVCVGDAKDVPSTLSDHVVVVELDASVPFASIDDAVAYLHDGRELRRDVLSPVVRQLLDGEWDRPADRMVPTRDAVPATSALRDTGTVVVRLLTAVPRVDGLAEPFEPGRERRAIELVAYLALRAGQPVTGERLRVRVLGNSSNDAAAKTLFNVASALRRSLGEGPLGQRLPPAGKLGRYLVATDVVCDVALFEARVTEARGCEVIEEKMAWLRAALELIEDEPFAAVLEGYDWFLTEGHLARLQTVCEDAACELAGLAAERGLVPLARFALERAKLIDPYSERLAAAAATLESPKRQASFEAIAPALRSTVPSAPTLT